MKRIFFSVLDGMIVFIAFIAFLGSARGVIIYDSGYNLYDGNGLPRVEYGTAATISIPSQSTLPGDTVAFWTSLDEYHDCWCPEAGQHWWAQAGFVIGLAPNGITYTQPEMYIETNGTTYSFQPIASAIWNTAHTFQVWVSPGTGAANFAIDGDQIASVGMPLNFNEGGQVTDKLEVHQSSNCCDTSSGSWSSLQFYDCWIVGQSCWESWDCGLNCYVQGNYSPPYYVSANSYTAFSVYTSTSGGCTGSCGGGGSPWVAVRDDDGQYLFLNDILRGGMFLRGQAWHDVTDYYVLPTAGVARNGYYTFMVMERNTAINYLDEFSAYEVDHPEGTNVLATLDGKMLTYGIPSSALSITDPTSGTPVDVTASLASSLATAVSDYDSPSGIYGSQGHALYADLGMVSSFSTKLIVHGANVPSLTTISTCLFCRQAITAYVQTKGGWTFAGKVFLRKGGSTEGLDLTPVIKDIGQMHLRVKLVYFGGERVDFIGLDRTPNGAVSLTSMPLNLALCGPQADVTSKLLFQDNTYLVYGALQSFTATFSDAPPPATGFVRDIMLVSAGHYIA